MATSTFPQRFVPVEANTASGEAHGHDEGIGAQLMARVRRFYCGLHGHDNLMHFEKKRMYLQCASCGHETAGWSLTATPPKVAFRGDRRRHMLMHPHLGGARRLA